MRAAQTPEQKAAAVAEGGQVITADTITDEQIRELRGVACDSGDVTTWRICDVALGGPPDDLCRECPVCGNGPDQPCRSTARRAFKHSLNARPRIVRTHPTRRLDRDGARARCAEILNARAKDGAK